METLYNWLLHNTENAGNYYTILNTHREGADYLEVMARSSDFRIVNLSIHDTRNDHSSAGQSEPFSKKPSAESYVFSHEQQVIAYLTDGKAPDPQNSDSATGIRVVVAEPDGDAGDVTFPPA